MIASRLERLEQIMILLPPCFTDGIRLCECGHHSLNIYLCISQAEQPKGFTFDSSVHRIFFQEPSGLPMSSWKLDCRQGAMFFLKSFVVASFFQVCHLVVQRCPDGQTLLVLLHTWQNRLSPSNFSVDRRYGPSGAGTKYLHICLLDRFLVFNFAALTFLLDMRYC